MRDNVILSKVDFNLRKYLASKRHAARKFNIPNPHAITFRYLVVAGLSFFTFFIHWQKDVDEFF